MLIDETSDCALVERMRFCGWATRSRSRQQRYLESAQFCKPYGLAVALMGGDATKMSLVPSTCLVLPGRTTPGSELPLVIMISPEPLSDSPWVPHLAPSSSEAFGLSASGRVQTRLFSFNSEQRLRNLPSVTEDLEKQDGPDPEDCDDGMYDGDNRQLAVKRRFLWLLRAFMWFSALFFPISVIGNYGIFLRRPSVNRFGGDHELGPRNCQKVSISTK